MKLTSSELATVLAALRFFQEETQEDEREDMAHFDEEARPLTNEEIDDLCERINCEPDEPLAESLVKTLIAMPEAIYVGEEDRFVVLLAAGYTYRHCRTPKRAAAAALALTNDGAEEDTNWLVLDRAKKKLITLRQAEFANEGVYLMERNTIIKQAAVEAAEASRDAHGYLVPSEEALAFITTVNLEGEETPQSEERVKVLLSLSESERGLFWLWYWYPESPDEPRGSRAKRAVMRVGSI